MNKTQLELLAHDLRTPLSVIRINLEFLLMHTRLEPSLRESVQTNIQQIDRIVEIIKDFQHAHRDAA